jgi:hypothetical protein
LFSLVKKNILTNNSQFSPFYVTSKYFFKQKNTFVVFFFFFLLLFFYGVLGWVQWGGEIAQL